MCALVTGVQTCALPIYWPQDYSFAAMEHPITPQQIVDRWAKKPLDFPPGTQWQYSNTGYVVAGLIVEKVSGMKLLDFLKAPLFGSEERRGEKECVSTCRSRWAPYH